MFFSNAYFELLQKHNCLLTHAFLGMFFKPFKKVRTTCFIGSKTTRVRLVVCDPIKLTPACFLFFKVILQAFSIMWGFYFAHHTLRFFLFIARRHISKIGSHLRAKARNRHRQIYNLIRYLVRRDVLCKLVALVGR